MDINFSFLANYAFGWIFIWAEIALFYAGFLIFHRMVEKRRRKRSG